MIKHHKRARGSTPAALFPPGADHSEGVPSVLYESSMEFHFKLIQGKLHTTSLQPPLFSFKEILISNMLKFILRTNLKTTCK